MTEVKTIADYINALPDEIREEVRMANENPKNFGTDLTTEIDEMDVKEGVIEGMFIYPLFGCRKWSAINLKYTLTEKEGKYYTNW